AAACASCQQVLERLAASDAGLRPAERRPDTLPSTSPGQDEAFLGKLAASPPWAPPSDPQAPASRDVLAAEVSPGRDLLRWQERLARGKHATVEQAPTDADDAAGPASPGQVTGYEVLGLLGSGG